jgi:hypothetical protein
LGAGGSAGIQSFGSGTIKSNNRSSFSVDFLGLGLYARLSLVCPVREDDNVSQYGNGHRVEHQIIIVVQF